MISQVLNALRSGHLAAGELAEMGFEVVSNHCMNGHQAEHTGFPYTALRVVVTLFNQIRKIRNLQSPLFRTKESDNVFMYECVGGVRAGAVSVLHIL